MSHADRLLTATRRLARAVDGLAFAAPVHTVYNPLGYAAAPHRAYVRRFVSGPKRAVFLGMNPGPFGMVQTGIPFGEIEAVRGFLRIEAPVGKPVPEHPKRPVTGFACTRSEVSGARLWGAIAEHWKTPERFFGDFYVANYCPLVFMEASGRNRTPDKLPASEREPLYAACDQHLRALVRILEPEWVIGVGAFAESRAREVLGEDGPRIGRVLHPSPASPVANRGWAAAARKELEAIGICQ